ncbi:hypothetical protein QF037_000104 [Streptomyces canus]|uniref:hypothetical protein n=1 Tax=Streptomyces canus TaxID=58343 RepID=UPI00277EA2BD|nr:hypothetical protein [Streptomyces canus]MDQ0595759.1 hypothetical protein [Streptomyces canus]
MPPSPPPTKLRTRPEVDDAGSRPVSATATVVPVERGATELPLLRHEFGDTKHRRVTYTLTANSRFRAFYDDGTPDDFRASAPTPEVVVPSSARPTAPKVLSVVPAFTWTTDQEDDVITHRRLGNRLRVELARPWFTTGADEQLALLVAQGDPDEDLLPYVTLLGRDPIWDTAIPPRSPTLNGTPVVLSETGGRVLAVGHPVWSHGDSWYADVPLPATNSYSPLVRPALARLQPHSLQGLALSPAVRADFVPLLPDRTLTVEPAPDDMLQITLDGIGPDGPEPNSVRVSVERLTDTGVEGAASDPNDPEAAGWVPVGGARGELGVTLLADAPGPGPLRVRVREIELIPGGEARPLPDGVEPDQPSELADRVVFTDVVPIG